MNGTMRLIAMACAAGLALPAATASDVGEPEAKHPQVVKGMVLVPAGWFVMGCDPEAPGADCATNDTPARKVFLEDFWIDRYEVTMGHYKFCVDAGVCTTEGVSAFPWPPSGILSDPRACTGEALVIGGGYYANSPMNLVDWHQARTFCNWAGKRLPTEAEWEKAARGPDGQRYPWGDKGYSEVENVANIADADYARYRGGHPTEKVAYSDGAVVYANVCRYPNGASPCGAEDMVGNLWEWVADWYGDHHDPSAPERNPKGPATGDSKVIRGCSFADLPRVCRATARQKAVPTDHRFTVGFRCATDSALEDGVPAPTRAQ